VRVDDGNSTLFWQDPWLDRKSIQGIALYLVVVVPEWYRPGQAWLHDIVGSYTVPVLAQYLQVWAMVDAVPLDLTTRDEFRWHGRLIRPRSRVRRHSTEKKSYGISGLLTSVACLFGLSYMIIAGHWKEDTGMDSRMTMTVPSVPSMPSPLITVWFKSLRRLGWQGVAPPIGVDGFAP
jgi:hypothetical protein